MALELSPLRHIVEPPASYPWSVAPLQIRHPFDRPHSLCFTLPYSSRPSAVPAARPALLPAVIPGSFIVRNLICFPAESMSCFPYMIMRPTHPDSCSLLKPGKRSTLKRAFKHNKPTFLLLKQGSSEKHTETRGSHH